MLYHFIRQIELNIAQNNHKQPVNKMTHLCEFTHLMVSPQISNINSTTKFDPCILHQNPRIMDDSSNELPPSDILSPLTKTSTTIPTPSKEYTPCPATWLGMIEVDMDNDHPLRNSIIHFEPSQVDELQTWITTWKLHSKTHAKNTLRTITEQVFISSKDFARDNNVEFDRLTPTLCLLSCVGLSLVDVNCSFGQAEALVGYLSDLLGLYGRVGLRPIWAMSYEVYEESGAEA